MYGSKTVREFIFDWKLNFAPRPGQNFIVASLYLSAPSINSMLVHLYNKRNIAIHS